MPGTGELPTLTFGMEDEIAILNTNESEQDPTVRSDEREMYFGARRDMGPPGIFRSIRGPGPDAEWEEATVVDSLTDSDNQYTPMLMADELTMTLSMSPPMSPADVYITRRSDINSDQWSMPERVPSLDGGSELSAHFIDDGLTAYFCSTRGTPTEALYRAVRSDLDSDFDDAVPIQTGLASDVQCNPWIARDESLLLFRATLGTNEENDLYMMRGTDGNLNPAELLEISNSALVESDPWLVINPDTCRGHLYFTRELVPGDPDIWWVEVTLGVE